MPLALGGALPTLQQPAHWHVLIVLGIVGLALATLAVLGRVSRLLLWAAVLLCSEELIALEVGVRPARGWTFAFAVLLFVGIEFAYSATERAPSPRPVLVYSRLLWPIVAAIVAAGLIALMPGASLVGLGLLVVGLGAAAALVLILAVLALRTEGSPGK